MGAVHSQPQAAILQFLRRRQRFLDQLVQARELARQRIEPLARLGEPDTPSFAMQQLDAMPLLQGLDLDRQRRLRQPEHLGCPRKAAFARHRIEGPDLRVDHR